MIEQKIKSEIRDVPNFPKDGIIFKDITPLLANPYLVREIVEAFCTEIIPLKPDVIVAVESRGFLFGMMIANHLNLPFVPVRKKGKLPGETIEQSYQLEYGSATIEIHKDAIQPGMKVLIHDDLLATGGTVEAVAKMIVKMNANVAGFCFLVNLDFLEGKTKIESYSDNIITLVSY